MSQVPTYLEFPGQLDLGIIIGDTWGPIFIEPEVSEDISGRAYCAAVYDRFGAKIADFAVEVTDVTLGNISIAMTEAESAKLAQGMQSWALWYVDPEMGKNTIASGNVEARYR
jgi:hypothetical protein